MLKDNWKKAKLLKMMEMLKVYRPDTIARIRPDYVHEQQSCYRMAIEERSYDGNTEGGITG